MASSANGYGGVLKRANPNTIQDKFLVGYQGWFTCGGDGPPVHKGHHGWLHWFNKPLPDGGKASFDLWPDISAYTPSELFPAPGLTMSSGSPALLFSSRHPQTVQRHFHWMAEHSVDGAFYQRFAGQCEADGRTEGTTADIMRLRDEVLDRVREAAEREGRVWAVMYDVSGVPNDRIEKIIKVDWNHLLWDKRILDSPYYLKEGGRPVIALWGFGFAGRGHCPDTVRRILRHIRTVTPCGAYIMAGTPTHWRTLRGDADPNPEFLSVWYNEFDAVSPWTVGRFHNEETIDRFAKEKLLPDLQALEDPANTHGRKIDYIPVVFPGASGFNLSDGRWKLNEQPRDGGRFLWRQLYHVLKRTIQAKIIYGAMWDEYDEGTAFLPAVSKKRESPVEARDRFIALDADGYDLPPDWYMRIAGFAGEMIRGERGVHETFPVKDLQDYWSSRPKYEIAPIPGPSSSEASGSGVASGSGTGNENVEQSFEEWCAQEKEGQDDVPPPPYTLEAEPSSAAPVGQPQVQNQTPGQQEQRGEEGPPVPLQTRPGSLTASQLSAPSSSVPPSGDHGRPQVPLASRPSLSSHPPAPAPPMATRPPSLPSSSVPPVPGAPLSPYPANSAPQVSTYESPYQVYSPARPHAHALPHEHHGHHHHNQAGYSPMYVVPGQASSNAPPMSPTVAQQQPNWSTHPHPGPQAPSMVSSLSDQFGRQSLHDAPPAGSGSAPGSAQWPPPEWGVSNQTSAAPVPPPRPHSSSRPSSSHPSSASTSPRPPTSSLPPSPLPPPLHPARPGRPPSRPAHSPSSGGNFGRTGSTSPNPASRPPPSPRPGPSPSFVPGMPTPGSSSGPGWAPTFNPNSDYDANYGGMPGASFPQPHSQAPYAHQMMPSSPSEPSASSSAYPHAYPDVTQGFLNAVPSQPPAPAPGAGTGGFYMGPHPPPPPSRYPQYPGSAPEGGPGPGSTYPPPPPPPRHSGQTTSVRPGQVVPGTAPAASSSAPSTTQNQQENSAASQAQPQGSGPGGFRFTDAYNRTLGAVDKLTGTNARKKIEGGIGSLSSAGSKVYQRFRS